MPIRFVIPLMFAVIIFLCLAIVGYNKQTIQPVDHAENHGVQSMPDFVLSTIGVQRAKMDRVDQSIFIGKTSIICIWSVNCLACLQEHEVVKRLASDKNYNFIGINYKNDRETADQWLHSFGDPYRFSISDPEGLLSLRLGVRGLPMTMMVDKTGKVIVKHVGVLTNDVWKQKFIIED